MDQRRALLDSNALVREGFGTSSAFKHLLREAKDGRIEVMVPETAVAEAVFVYRRRLFDAREVLQALPPLLRAAERNPVPLERQGLVSQMEQTLRRRLEEGGVNIEAAPNIDADEIVRRIHARHKPTKPLSQSGDGQELPEQGEGFRDQLIWEQVRAAAERGPLIFVTDNTRDFGRRKSRKDGRAELHPDLVEDLAKDKSSGRSDGEVELVLDIPSLVRHYLQDEDVMAETARLLDQGAGDLLRDEVMERLARGEIPVAEYVPDLAIIGDVEEATLTSLSRDLDVQLEDSYLESAEGEPRVYGVSAQVVGDGDVDWLVSGPTSWDLEEFFGYVDGDSTGGGFIADVCSSRVEVSVSGLYSPSEGSWLSVEVESVQQIEEERLQRAEEHAEREFAREQRLGLAPSDEELLEEDARLGGNNKEAWRPRKRAKG